MMKAMQPKANFWVERRGQVVLSEWRVRLLEAIEERGSISGAARKQGVHFRVAWRKIREMEERLGVRLVDGHRGGQEGGGAKLTPQGKEFVRRFRKFTKGLDGIVRRQFDKAFGSRK